VTDGLAYCFGAANNSDSAILSGHGIFNTDVCTTEMLGNAHDALQVEQNTVYNREMQRKLEKRSLWFCAFSSLPLFRSKFFSSANDHTETAETSTAEIIHFIHNKDGKKKI
jgi:hypothetical protein